MSTRTSVHLDEIARLGRETADRLLDERMRTLGYYFTPEQLTKLRAVLRSGEEQR